MKKIGLALGAGGARGLAHITILQAFEELGVQPSIISGTSIGAVIGVAFASGLSTAEMREAVEELRAAQPGKFWHIESAELKVAIALLDPTTETGGLIKGEKFIRFLESKIQATRFEDLKIPLRVVATNYWKKEQVVLSKGGLWPAVRSSYSMPGLFMPVKIGKEIFVDGGLMNPLPYDVVQPHCDITVAIDVSAVRTNGKNEVPHAYDVLFSAFQMMQNSIVREKLQKAKPDILIKTDIKNVRSLEFNLADSIYEQALPAKRELKKRLEKVLRR